MLKIFENQALLKKRDELREQFKQKKRDGLFLSNAVDVLKDIDEWKYSTGAIFNQPPYGHEMAGFDGGRILKKSYPSPYVARLKGGYSSGFVSGIHKITISPAKAGDSPLAISSFCWDSETLFTSHVKYYNHVDFESEKAPSLVGLGIFYIFDDGIRAEIGVGDFDAFTITLFYYNKENLILAASSITAPFTFQSEYEMHYDPERILASITSGDMVVWKRKGLK